MMDEPAPAVMLDEMHNLGDLQATRAAYQTCLLAAPSTMALTMSRRSFAVRPRYGITFRDRFEVAAKLVKGAEAVLGWRSKLIPPRVDARNITV